MPESTSYILKTLIEKLQKWYKGKYKTGRLYDSPEIYFVGKGKYIPTISAKVIRLLINFWLKRWPILLPIIVAAFVAFFIHFDSKSAGKPAQKTDKPIKNPVIHVIPKNTI